MECLVTGAGGFVGRAVVEALAAAGHTGVATGREAPGGLPEGWAGRRRDELLAGGFAWRPEAIVHLESRQAGPRPGRGDAAECEAVNVGGTRAWLDWAARVGTRRFVLVSSILAVAPSAGRRDEDAPPAVGEGYGPSKARAEEALRRWCREDVSRRGTILRPVAVYGPDEGSNLVALVRRIVASRPVIVGEGRALRSIVSRRNLAAAVLFVLGREAAGCEVFTVSDPRPMRLSELVATVAEVADVAVPRPIPRWAAALAAPVGDLLRLITGREMPIGRERLMAQFTDVDHPCERLLAAGFRHPESSREGLARLVEWLRASGDASPP